MAKENIFISPFPYFERFFPFYNGKKVNEYRKALVLSPDFFSIPLEKLDSEYKFYYEVQTL